MKFLVVVVGSVLSHWSHCSVSCGLGYKCEHNRDLTFHTCMPCYIDCDKPETQDESDQNATPYTDPSELDDQRYASFYI